MIRIYFERNEKGIQNGSTQNGTVREAEMLVGMARDWYLSYMVYLMSINKNVPLGMLFLWEAGGICQCKN